MIVIGAGSIGERHLRCFAATGLADVGFVEIRDELREQVATRYPRAAPFADIAGALERYRPTAAVIATPAPLHIGQAIELARRGVHLLIEKPLSVTMDRVDELFAARNVMIGIAYVYRAHPALAAMRDAIASGRFRSPVQIVATCGQNFPHYRPAYRDIYYAKHASGGGAVQDALTHVINAGEWLVGPISRLAADAAHQVLEGVDVEDTVHVVARHGEHVMGSYSLNQHQAPNETTITVACEQGTARFEFHRGQWSWMEKPDTPWNVETTPPLERDALFTRQANAFLDAVEGRSLPLCSLGEGVQTLKVNLAILHAARERKWEVVP